jgi:hypothetical protein
MLSFFSWIKDQARRAMFEGITQGVAEAARDLSRGQVIDVIDEQPALPDPAASTNGKRRVASK